ncbi:MAG: hypothetical protein ACK4M1_06150 [Flavobacterium sp.]
MSATFELIDKEIIPTLNFPKSDVLDDKEALAERKNHLDRALSLGNLEHVKIKIYFEDDSSRKMVETTIWGVTDERVILKQGVVIPVKRIYKIV